ncbi:rRNA methyltransferase 3, mitochondrial isoform X1 [Lissotriton helveticus]
MAALMRGMSVALLGSFWKGGAVQARRSVRALRRRPVQVLYSENDEASARQNAGAPNFTSEKQSLKPRRPAPQRDTNDSLSHLRSGSFSSTREKPGHGGNWKAETLKPIGGRKSREGIQKSGTVAFAGGSQDSGQYIRTRSSARGASPGASRDPESFLEGLRYEKALPDDRRLAKVVTIAKSKKFRDKHGKILLEGRRLITDALETGAELQTLFFSTVDHLKELPLSKLKRVQLLKVKFEEIKIWSDLVTPQGVIGIFARPDHSKMCYPASQVDCSLPLTLICDNIRDPGNLGTILRSAAGAGCSKVLLTKGCVDAWEPKVLRAGMGAHFRIPVITSLEWDVLRNYLSEDTRVYVADNCSTNTRHNMDNKRVKDQDLNNSTGLKGNSLSRKASDYGWVSTHPKKMSAHADDYFSSGDESDESEDEEMLGNASLPELNVQSYHDCWAQDPAALIIGGETQGLSLESLQLAESMGGAILLIPIVPGVESLNSAMAASILLFEGKRQLQLRKSPETRSKRHSMLA